MNKFNKKLSICLFSTFFIFSSSAAFCDYRLIADEFGVTGVGSIDALFFNLAAIFGVGFWGLSVVALKANKNKFLFIIGGIGAILIEFGGNKGAINLGYILVFISIAVWVVAWLFEQQNRG